MPVKSLESYLFERGLVGTCPIEALKNATVGIDVNHYVSRVLTPKREQYLDAIGGFPTSLKTYLESDLLVFKEYNITPIFVFSGSSVANQLEADEYYTAAAEAAEAAASAANVPSNASLGSAMSSTKTTKESILAQRNRGWTQWNNLLWNAQSSYIDLPSRPPEVFRYNIPLEASRFKDDLIQFFISRNIYYQVAPYSSWSQLAYLLQKKYIDVIYGPTDVLMLDVVDKFIIGMEFPNKEFRFIERHRILSELKCSSEEFIDICMAVGNDLQPFSLPPLQLYPPQQLFEMALEMVINSGTDFYAHQLLNPLKMGDSTPVKRYQKGVSALNFMPVLKENGRVELFSENEMIDESGKEPSNSSMSSPPSSGSSDTIPNDLHDVLAQRLPHEYYFYKSVGIIGNALLDAITTGVYPEEPPLDGGISASYRQLVNQSVEMFKNQGINLLTQPINRYYQIKPIKQVNWFAPEDSITLTNRMAPSTFDKVNHLVIKTDDFTKNFSLFEFIQHLNGLENLETLVSDKILFADSVPAGERLRAPFDLLATNLLRLLTMLEFFEYDTSAKKLKTTPYGRIFLQLCDLGVKHEHLETMLTFLVFSKMGVLRLSDDSQSATPSALSKATLQSYPTESAYILVLARALTLFKLDQKPSNYHGPIDKKTLVFSDLLDYVRKNTNELFEAVVVSSLAAGEFDRLSLDNLAWQKDLVALMPFKASAPSTVAAMMWEFYLQKYLHNGSSKPDAMALVVTIFNTYKSIPNLDEEFSRSLSYLESFVSVLEQMAKEKLLDADDYDLFKTAYTFAKNSYTE
ncbi:LAMI_0F09846g1_1 [Lachancea mirantina]|uniref:LAMI_0F09846g1_1 n=1 Tax=Lachancea mirantina TaxID=1230905 RepID=A0A1G4K1E9_9SACH|nr:LAMI_0F09846g1_1 [Lachancea mirantina]